MRLQDKVILVTGSTTGIGEAIARRAVAEGARVLIHGRDEKRGQALVAELGPRTALHVDDIADPAAPKRIVAAAIDAFGQLNALVNNAATVQRSNLSNTDAALFDKIIAINLRAPMLLIQAAVPHLKRTRGSVLNIGSLNGHCGEANLLAYSISKGGLITLSRNLADALGPAGVRVNHFNVGWVLTPNEYHVKIADGLPPDWPERIPATKAPIGRLMKPEEIASAAIFWISDESYPISGSIIDMEQHPVVGRNPPKEVKETANG
jgi:NAD(P)-dependent dehydrogenase (short-subunit alcohol dehydrogenase family)